MEFKDSKTKAKNREKLVQSAHALFMDKGIGLTSIKEIMENADMERKTFYTFFESKDQLAEYIFLNTMNTIKEFNYDGAVSGNGFEKISFLLNLYIQHLLNLKDEISYTMHYDYYFRKEANVNYMIELFDIDNDSSLFSMYKIAEEGIKDGSVNLSDNYEMELTMLVHSILGFVQRMIFREPILNAEIEGMIHQRYTDDDIKKLVNILINGIKK